MVLSSILIGGLWPTLVQQLQVKPNEQAKESPYIARSIENTRAAYGVKDVTVTSYAATETIDQASVKRDQSTLDSIRLIDPNLLGPTFQQLQQIKGFYSFAGSLDIARLLVNGKPQTTVASVREVNLDGIPESQRNWVTSTLIYTHGIGMVAAPDNSVAADGQPNFIEADVPPSGALNIKEPRIYFGEQSPLYSIVGAPAGSQPRELDYPDDKVASGQQNNTYNGTGGVPVGSLLNRFLFAARFSEQNILLSSQINDASRILYVREPRARVEKVAPWLTVDSDAYPVVLNGRITWVLDGYTTTSKYPYSQTTRLTDAVTDSVTTPALDLRGVSVNYMRNAVKATVDAYDGTVQLYAWDDQDPILKTWAKAFPNTVKPKSAIPADLVQQLRYPEDLFKVQREVLKKYHITDAPSFFSGENFWIIPEDPTRGGGMQPPYFLSLKMPGASAQQFSVTSTYAPQKRPSLAGLLVVNSEQVQDRRVQVVDVRATGDRVGAEFVGHAVGVAAFHAAAGEPHREGGRVEEAQPRRRVEVDRRPVVVGAQRPVEPLRHVGRGARDAGRERRPGSDREVGRPLPAAQDEVARQRGLEHGGHEQGDERGPARLAPGVAL